MNNVILAVGFVIFMLFFCILWNKIMMSSYKKMRDREKA